MLASRLGIGGFDLDLQTKLLGALLITYLVSRLTLRLPTPLSKVWGISLAHAAAFGLTIAGLVALRGTAHAPVGEQMALYVSPQIFWWLLDLLREHRLTVLVTGKRSRQ